MARVARAGEETHMASKDKGGRNEKTAASKTAKEKKQDKRAKKQGKGAASPS